MVDVGAKPDTERIAIARGEVHMKKETFDLIRAGQIKKGDVLTVAQIAGITASKRTSELIPLCHPLFLSKVDVDLVLDESIPGVVITATVKVTWQNRRGDGSIDRCLCRGVDRVRHGQSRRKDHANSKYPPDRKTWRSIGDV